MNLYDFASSILSTLLPKSETPTRSLSYLNYTPSTHKKSNNG